MNTMKKNIFMALVLAVGLTACTQDDTEWAKPQTTEQGDIANISMTVKVSAPDAMIDMEKVEGDMVQLFVPVEVSGTVEPDYYVTLMSPDSLTTTVKVDAQGYASKDDLAAAIVTLFGKKQAERTMVAQAVAQTVVDGVTLKSSSEKYTLVVLPAVPDMNYWVYGKQNNMDSKEKTLPLMPASKESQTVTTWFTTKRNALIWSDDTFGDDTQGYGAKATANSGEFILGGAYIDPASGEGWYTLTFNFVDYTYTFTKLENQSPTEYATISLSGEFNSWGDMQLTQVPSRSNAWNSHCWYALGVELTAGGVKFRAENAWTVNWGADVDVATSQYGKGTQNGDNITVPTGTYDVYFNDITGEFLFIQQ